MTSEMRWSCFLDMLRPVRIVRWPLPCGRHSLCVCFQVATKEAIQRLRYKAFKTSKLTFIQSREIGGINKLIAITGSAEIEASQY